MCYSDTETDEYRRVRIIHRRPAALSSCYRPRRPCYSYSYSSHSNGRSSNSSSYDYCTSDSDCESDNETLICRPHRRPRCYSPPSCSRPSYTTVTRTRTRTREETVYSPRRSRFFDCEPVRRYCEPARRVYRF